jgi:Fe-S cluster assembly protein SufB
MTSTAHPELDGLGRYEYGWSDSDAAGAKAKRGLSARSVHSRTSRSGCWTSG